jgi:mono/diheme cytochrome c family protein
VTSQSCTYVPPPPPPPATCTAFTYSTWGACQANGTQTRTILSSSPSGCTGGSPVLSQACTPPAPDGAALYTQTCAGCHGALASSNLKGKGITLTSIKSAGMTQGLTDAQLQAIVTAVNGATPPPPAACTYTYSAWAACQSSGTQTRTVVSSSPSGCTGTPALSQPCTYVPPVTTCSAFTYSAWGACQSNNTQTRTVLTSSPSGCTGGTPVTSQACTYTPPVDGASLYASSCAGCHGALASSNLKGKNISVSLIQSKGMTQGLSTTQLQAIVTAVGP